MKGNKRRQFVLQRAVVRCETAHIPVVSSSLSSYAERLPSRHDRVSPVTGKKSFMVLPSGHLYAKKSGTTGAEGFRLFQKWKLTRHFFIPISIIPEAFQVSFSLLS